eukprot:CAMPEP_0204914232 /NCGR_PEP_ID=MMETSP1397-20131031/12066_1 /ASSEMBLY_ACC=CAM_ASM_000891 /TAXON_ID=49980 /ORGANISM="Climacostomum Climacostomum virens, Strain Stock W-24" /LENGTH=616 /DNA_ID=CAMNT_0052085689 /DNA_START=56 /DNA_END=1906 /DNA_ORIENTATION=-
MHRLLRTLTSYPSFSQTTTHLPSTVRRAFFFSKPLYAANIIKVEGQGLNFEMPSYTDLSEINLKVSQELNSSIYALRVQESIILTNYRLQELVRQSATPDLKLLIDRSCFDLFAKIGNRKNLLEKLEKSVKLPSRKVKQFYLFFLSYARVLLNDNQSDSLERLCALILNSNQAGTETGYRVIFYYARSIARKKPAEAKELLLKIGTFTDMQMESIRVAILADSLSYLQEYDDARNLCVTALKLLETHTLSQWATGRLKFLLFSLNLKDDLPTSVEEIVEAKKLLETSKDEVELDLIEASYAAGLYYMLSGNVKEAYISLSNSYEKLKELGEKELASKIAVNLSTVLMDEQDFGLAEEILQEVTVEPSSSYRIHMLKYAILLSETRRCTEAVEKLGTLEHYLKHEPNSAEDLLECLTLKGQCLLDGLENIEEAEEVFRELYALLQNSERLNDKAEVMIALSRCISALGKDEAQIRTMLEEIWSLRKDKSLEPSTLGTAIRMLASLKMKSGVIEGVGEMLAFTDTLEEDIAIEDQVTAHLLKFDYFMAIEDYVEADYYLKRSAKAFKNAVTLTLDDPIYESLKAATRELFAKLGKSNTKEEKQSLRSLEKSKKSRLLK